jgi:hypothetical protein
MANYQLINASASPEVQMNENFGSIEAFFVYAKNPTTSTGLTHGYFGGRWGGFSVAAGTLSLTAGGGSPSTYNHIVVAKASGVISCSTSDTNWNDTTNYSRVYRIETSASAVIATEDHRAGAYGIFGGTGGGTVYSDFVGDVGSPGGGVAGLVPAPVSGDGTKYLKGDGTWAAVATSSDFIGDAGSPGGGSAGLVPAPVLGDRDRVLRGDGGWDSIAAMLDTISSTQGTILYRNASAWVALGTGTAGQRLKTNGASANPAWVDEAVTLPVSKAGKPGSSELLFDFICTFDLVIPSSLSGSSVKAGTAANAQTDFLLKDDGSTVATIRFAASGTTASFVSVSAGTISAGSRVTFESPGSQDSTLADLYGGIHLLRN